MICRKVPDGGMTVYPRPSRPRIATGLLGREPFGPGLVGAELADKGVVDDVGPAGSGGADVDLGVPSGRPQGAIRAFGQKIGLGLEVPHLAKGGGEGRSAPARPAPWECRTSPGPGGARSSWTWATISLRVMAARPILVRTKACPGTEDERARVRMNTSPWYRSRRVPGAGSWTMGASFSMGQLLWRISGYRRARGRSLR